MRNTTLLWALGASFLAGGCLGGQSGHQTSSDNVFLTACEAHDECEDEGLECLCGVCTRVCTSDAACGELSGEARCLDTPSTDLSCDVASVKIDSICGVQCNSDGGCSDLGDGATCEQGVCVAPPPAVMDEDPMEPDTGTDTVDGALGGTDCDQGIVYEPNGCKADFTWYGLDPKTNECVIAGMGCPVPDGAYDSAEECASACGVEVTPVGDGDGDGDGPAGGTCDLENFCERICNGESPDTSGCDSLPGCGGVCEVDECVDDSDCLLAQDACCPASATQGRIDQEQCLVTGGDTLPDSCQCMSAAPCQVGEPTCIMGFCGFTQP